jgi:citrate/tricarballylate utilization protein
LVSYGFVLCLFSTISAAIEQDLVGIHPPYGFVSAPVLLGLVGGAGLVVGSAGLLSLKRRTDPASSDVAMQRRDVGFLWALVALAATGLVTLIVRSTAAFGIIFGLHLEVIVVCFLLAPVSKFVHLAYRLLAIVQDNLESDAERKIREAAPHGH